MYNVNILFLKLELGLHANCAMKKQQNFIFQKPPKKSSINSGLDELGSDGKNT